MGSIFLHKCNISFTEYYVASFSYSSSEPGDLSFNQGDSILVIKKDGAWWTGIIGDTTGIFPANYVTEPSTEVWRRGDGPPGGVISWMHAIITFYTVIV